MSTDTTTDDTADEAATGEYTNDNSDQLDADAVEQLAHDERQATKTLAFETDRGVARYGYQMIREGRLAELSDQHFGTPEVSGRRQAQQVDVSEEDYERFRADVLKEAIVDAPAGHKNSRQYIRRSVPDEWQAELFDAITEFSSMDEETRRKFR